MLEGLLHFDKDGPGSLQAKLREKLTEMIARGFLEEGQKLPSTRSLARYLGISRTTVTLVYQDLVSDSYIESINRSGFVVSAVKAAPVGQLPDEPGRSVVDWKKLSTVTGVVRRAPYGNKAWRKAKYPFVYGQHDRWLFPISNWRKCSRDSLSLHDVHDWTVDYVDGDDPLLIDAFRRRILPRRGVAIDQSQVLVTVGAQNALFLIAQTLIRPGTVVGIEEPSYPDAREIFKLFGATLRPIPVDDDGLIVDGRLDGCDFVYVTPSYQSPTTVTMSDARRSALLEAARRYEFVIFEDDYDTESRFGTVSNLALKNLDHDGRVVYVTSLSKLLSPGLRVGFLVGPAPLIEEIRAVRRLNIRHPAANNQRTVALFLKGGHYEALLKQFHKEYNVRRRTLVKAVQKHMPEARISPSFGGSSLWLKLPDDIDTDELTDRCFDNGVVIEPGGHHFMSDRPSGSYLRLGYSSIQPKDIEPGIAILAKQISMLLRGR